MKEEVVDKTRKITNNTGNKCPDCRSYKTIIEKITPGALKRIFMIITMQQVISTYHYRCADCGAGWTRRIKDKK
jgi:DNA-directed RNA polymerase subunit RPC12/RpoP